MTKQLKKQLLDKMLQAGNYFFFRPLANELGIKQLSRAETEGIMKSYLIKRPDMKAYYDDSNNNSFFCGLWFAEKSIVFEDYVDEFSEDLEAPDNTIEVINHIDSEDFELFMENEYETDDNDYCEDDEDDN